MDGIDDTDRRILELLLEDARRPYSDIAEQVDLSGPAVSDRVERLQERGLIRGFTVDVERTLLRRGRPILIRMTAEPGAGTSVQRALTDSDPIEQGFRTVDDDLVFVATAPATDVATLLDSAGVLEDVASYDVDLLADRFRSDSLAAARLAPECAECGNTVDEEGVTATIGGERYDFCCPSCESNFRTQYEELREGL